MAFGWFGVIVVRLLVLLGLLGVMVLGVGCPSPLPEMEDGGSGSSVGSEDSTGGVGTSSGSGEADVDTAVDETGEA